VIPEVGTAAGRHMVGMGEMAVSRTAGETLAAYGVGSCIILCAWDALTRVAGMAHVVQPRSPAGQAGNARFADAAVPALVALLESAGAVAHQLVVKIAGGAALLQPSQKIHGETLGELNARAVHQALAARGLRLAAHDVGGEHGRNVLIDVASGTVVVKTLKRGELTL
jgi:chemotaxis protein CheD